MCVLCSLIISRQSRVKIFTNYKNFKLFLKFLSVAIQCSTSKIYSRNCKIHKSMKSFTFEYIRLYDTCVCMRTCVYVYVFVCTGTYVNVYICVYVCICVHVCVCVCMYVCMCVYVCVCVCVCVCVYKCVYTGFAIQVSCRRQNGLVACMRNI